MAAEHDAAWWVERWTIRWEALGGVRVASVRPRESTIVLDLAVPWPIPRPLIEQIDAKLAGRDDDADHCHTRRKLTIIPGGRTD